MHIEPFVPALPWALPFAGMLLAIPVLGVRRAVLVPVFLLVTLVFLR